jgi:Leucine-rich repeat (LRR) protein
VTIRRSGVWPEVGSGIASGVFAGALLLVAGLACFRDIAGPGIETFCDTASSSAIVTFEDAILEAEIRDALLIGPQSSLTCGLVETLTSLNAASAGVTNLGGIENLTGLTTLQIRGNSITDIRALAGLTGLTSLNLAANSITDVSPLSGLTNLTFLAINQNGTITDISALSGLTNLTGTLWIHSNAITDISAVSGLTNLTTLNAWNNSISDLSPLSGLTGLTQIRVHINSITDLGDLDGLPNLEIVWLHTNPDLTDIQTLLDNPGLGAEAAVNLRDTNVSCTDVDALRAKSVDVISDCL